MSTSRNDPDLFEHQFRKEGQGRNAILKINTPIPAPKWLPETNLKITKNWS